MDVAAFNRLAPHAASALLRPACASETWLAAVVGGRPYASVSELADCSDSVLAGLDWPAIEQALSAHPRIGERRTGTDAESAWSREEQAGAHDGVPSDVVAALRAGNVEYEQRFGYGFLICATGRTAGEMLAALTERIGNDPEAERQVVRRELAAIVRLRLAKALG